MQNIGIDTVKTGENIKKYRLKRKMTMRKVQDELGLNTVQTICKWERGDCIPRMDNFFAICRLFEVSPMDICVFCDNEYAKSISAICKGE